MSRPIGYSRVTPKNIYLNRRRFLTGAAALAALSPGALASNKLEGVVKSAFNAGGEKVTPYNFVTGYNNFYEFGTGKDEPAKHAENFRTRPWTVTLEGEVGAPKT